MVRPREGKNIICLKCEKVFYKNPSRKRKFCSRKCYNNYKRNWRFSSDGYLKTIINKKEIRQHRYIMEQQINRKLEKHEIIHHINGIKTDNRTENLCIMNNSQHAKLHSGGKNKNYAKDKFIYNKAQ